MDDQFFSRPETQQSIKTLARADTLVLFIGAGVSRSQGLPTWQQLCHRILLSDSQDITLTGSKEVLLLPTERDNYVDALFQAYDPWYLGSLIRDAHPTDKTLSRTIHEHLYASDEGKPFTPGCSNFVFSVCQLILSRLSQRRKTLVLTTNFDDILESALRSDAGLRSLWASADITAVSSVYDKKHLPPDPHALTIYHLHGFVPRQGTADEHKLTFSARDYGSSWSDHWSYDVLDQYWSCPWLFVGMSFIDPHISFYLSERHNLLTGNAAPPQESKAFGVFSLQGKAWSSLSRNVRLALSQAEVQRLDELGMIALPTDYYFQDAQLLREVGFAMRRDRRVPAYKKRIDKWYREFCSQRLSARNDSVRFAYLSDLSRTLQKIRQDIEKITGHHDERFKVELWARDADERALFQVGSSEFIPNDPARARRFSLTTKDDAAAAVAAFTRGTPHRMPAPQEQIHGRWRSFFAAPIYLQDKPWYDLPVGAIVIASTYPVKEPASCLMKNAALLQDELENWLKDLTLVLNPVISRKNDGKDAG